MRKKAPTSGVPDPEARHLTIDGRRWRRSDPAIPQTLRDELVSELMSARRAVQAALRAGEPAAEEHARARVHDAKLALGERGAAWWEQATEAQARVRAAAALRTLLRKRGPGKTLCPSEIARVIGGERWRASMALVRDLAATLADDGTIQVLQRGAVVDPRKARGAIRIAAAGPL